MIRAVLLVPLALGFLAPGVVAQEGPGADPPQDAAEATFPQVGSKAATAGEVRPEVPRQLPEHRAGEVLMRHRGPEGYPWEILSEDPLVFGQGGVDGTHAMAIPSRNVIVVYLTQSREQTVRGRRSGAALDTVAADLGLDSPLPSVAAVEAGLDVVELAPTSGPEDEAAGSDTVHVSQPTGETETDRASILAALDEVEPGGTVLFGKGTYVVGPVIRVETPRFTLLGHPGGTVLRGCDRDVFEASEREMAAALTAEDAMAAGAAWRRCGMLELTGGDVTVRDLTFELSRLGLLLGCCHLERRFEASVGGYLIEGNTFRNSHNGVRPWTTESSTIRGNRFVNTFHAVSGAGSHLRVLDNEMSVPEPGRVPGVGHPSFAVALSTISGRVAEAIGLDDNGEGVVVAGNRIEGHPDGIFISALPGTSFRNSQIRDNTIRVERVPIPASGVRSYIVDVQDQSDSTIVGVPLVLYPRAFPGAPDGGPEPGSFEDNVIAGNRLIGAEGIALALRRGARNRIVRNTIVGVKRRDPFPGNTVISSSEAWRVANGSGIWISPESEENQIAGNTFEDVAGAAVFLEGDSNRVGLRSADDVVRDLGSGNRVTAPDRGTDVSPDRPGPATPAPVRRLEPSDLDTWPVDVPLADTVRYTGIVNGMTGGERLLWREGPDAWGYGYDMGPSGFPRTERLALDEEGLPLELEVSGQKAPWDPWEERFEKAGDTARWTTTVDEGEGPVEGPSFYAALHPAHDPGVLARALLRRPSRRLPLLPAGEARLEALGERTVGRNGRTRTVRHYAVHGLDLKPTYVWLDESGATFADEWTVRAGWESVFPELKAASRAALADHVRGLAQRLMPPPRDRPLAIRGARLFDPTTGSVRPGTTILIEGNRVAAVGDDGDVRVPEGAAVIDAVGRTVLPGLWDMHAHHGTSLIGFFRYRELDAPLHLAGGVTTARDLGSHIDELVSLRRRIGSGEAIGPRLLAAGYIDGIGGSRTGVQVGTAEQARAAVDRFAELGYAQIKIYDQLPAELVPVVIERADRHGLRVSGHVPRGLSSREAVEAGFDELQHVERAVNGILGSVEELSVRWGEDWAAWADAQAALQPGSEPVRDFIGLLGARDVALDPTLALALAHEVPPHYIAPVLDRFPPQARRRLLDRFWSRPPEVVARWDRYVSSWTGFVHAAHEAGVPILPGTDLMPGFGLHRELELYVEAGVPAPEVLGLATLGAAREMGRVDDLGSVEPGKLADLILVDGEPTEDISDLRRVTTVVKGGTVYDPAAIYRALGIEPCCDPEPVKEPR